MKLCKYCGNDLNETDNYCSNCGKSVYDNPYQKSDNLSNVNYQEKSKYEQTSFVLGLTGLIFSVLNWIGFPFLHLIGMLLGGIGLSLVKKDKANGSFSKPGYVMSMIALILGITSMIVGAYLASR